MPPTSPPALTTAPKISGTLTQGLTVTATAGSWSNQPFAFARQWLRCEHSGLGCVGISGATSLSYTLTGADVGHTLVLRETATNAAGSTAGLSKPSGVVAGAVPVATLPPTINGVVQQGQTLTADHGRWTNEPTAYAYQWKRCNEKGGQCKPIAGAVARTYTPTSADVGKTLSVSETASNATGAGKPSPSGATAKVLPGAPEERGGPEDPRDGTGGPDAHLTGGQMDQRHDRTARAVAALRSRRMPPDRRGDAAHLQGRTRPTPACRSSCAKRLSTPAAGTPRCPNRCRSNPDG